MTKKGRAQRTFQAGVAILIGLTVSLGLAELLVRLVLPHPSFYLGHPGNVPGLVSPHSERGYSWTDGFDGRMATQDFSNRYLISSQGLRDDLVADQQEFRILAVGDSFTGGEGVEAGEAWPKQLQAILNAREDSSATIRVINGGVTGYGARQMRLMAQELVPNFKPRIVIMAVFSLGLDRIGNEFTLYGGHLVRSRDVPNITPHNDGYIWYRSTLSNQFLADLDLWCQKFAHFPAYVLKAAKRFGVVETAQRSVSPLEVGVDRSEIDALSVELQSLAQYLSNRQIAFMVLIVNQQEKDGSFSERGRQASDQIRSLCQSLGIQCIDPVDRMIAESDAGSSMRFNNDAHWSTAAHEIAAQVLADSLVIGRMGSEGL